MRRLVRFAVAAIAAAAASARGVGLPDTGQDVCYDGGAADTVPPTSTASIARDNGTFPRQDCRYGADPAATVAIQTKVGGGGKGFDYTKIANNGSTLPANAALGTAAADWACTMDNITGLTWEVKTPSGANLRSIDNYYTWYSTNSATNGGNPGSAGSNTCNGTLPGNLCNTQAYVAAVNAVALCGYTDWRLPTRRELFTLMRDDGIIPRVDPDYFPNSSIVPWTSSTNAQNTANAWGVSFTSPSSHFGAGAKAATSSALVVRGGPF